MPQFSYALLQRAVQGPGWHSAHVHSLHISRHHGTHLRQEVMLNQGEVLSLNYYFVHTHTEENSAMIAYFYEYELQREPVTIRGMCQIVSAWDHQSVYFQLK